MSESTLQFRVGLFVLVGLALSVALVLRFGELRYLWERRYSVAIVFDDAPNVQAGTPIRKSGLMIGVVNEVFFEEQGGVTVLASISEKHQLRKDAEARLTLSLLGDATIEFTPGRSRERLKPGAKIKGIKPVDPMQMVIGMEAKVSETLLSFQHTSDEWKKVGENINSLVDTNRGNLDVVVERAAESLHQFSLTMENANRLVGDPENQKQINAAIQALPLMVEDTRVAIASIRGTVESLEANLNNLKATTEPLAKHSESIIVKLDNSAGQLESLLGELNVFARQLADEEGSLNMLVSDPALYENLNRSASALSTVLGNIEPITEDLRILSDKLARHPELLGIGGAIQGSNGLKSTATPPTNPPTRTTQRPRFLPN